MPQSQGTALPRHQRKENLGTNKVVLNALYKTADTHTDEMNCNRETVLEQNGQ